MLVAGSVIEGIRTIDLFWIPHSSFIHLEQDLPPLESQLLSLRIKIEMFKNHTIKSNMESREIGGRGKRARIFEAEIAHQPANCVIKRINETPLDVRHKL